MPKARFPLAHLKRVVSLISSQDRISRRQLASKTGYSAFLISRLVEQLLEANIITELGTADSSGGRPPILLSVNPGAGHLVGIHMGSINVRVVVTDMLSNVVACRVEKSLVHRGPEYALGHVAEIVQSLLKGNSIESHRVLGAGLGISGILDREEGITLSWPKVPEWINVPVKKLLDDNLKVRVEVDDTSRTMALAERRFGKASSASEFLFLVLGAGAGAAIFLHNQLYTGKGGFAGEFGHISIDEHGPLCSCGNRGCVEVFVSASSIIRRAEDALNSGLSTGLFSIVQNKSSGITLEVIAQAAEAGDRFCISLLGETGVHVGVGVVGLVNLLNPELIVLGGGLCQAAGKWLLPSVHRIVQERAVQYSARQVTIELSELTEIDWARGATLLAAEKALHRQLSALSEKSDALLKSHSH